MGGEVARIVILVIVSALLIATSPTRPPSGTVERSNVLPAGERRLQAHVTARIEGGFASVTRPFLAQVYVNSASMPEVDGSPAAGAAVTASVRIDGDDRVFDSQEGIPAAGRCDDDVCRWGRSISRRMRNAHRRFRRSLATEIADHYLLLRAGRTVLGLIGWVTPTRRGWVRR
jgi:hypothetical protein